MWVGVAIPEVAVVVKVSVVVGHEVVYSLFLF
jgi:hypothetical protein